MIKNFLELIKFNKKDEIPTPAINEQELNQMSMKYFNQIVRKVPEIGLTFQKFSPNRHHLIYKGAYREGMVHVRFDRNYSEKDVTLIMNEVVEHTDFVMEAVQRFYQNNSVRFYKYLLAYTYNKHIQFEVDGLIKEIIYRNDKDLQEKLEEFFETERQNNVLGDGVYRIGGKQFTSLIRGSLGKRVKIEFVDDDKGW